MNNRVVTLVALSLGTLGIAGFAAGMTAKFRSGETVLEQAVAEAPPTSRGKKTRSPLAPTVHRYEMTLGERGPIVGTVTTHHAMATLRIFGPSGEVVHEKRYGGMDATTSFVPPIEIANPGAHRVEFEVDPRSSAFFELRRNAIVVTTQWMFAAGAMTMLGFIVVFLRVIRRANAFTKLALAARRERSSGDGS